MNVESIPFLGFFKELKGYINDYDYPRIYAQEGRKSTVFYLPHLSKKLSPVRVL